MNQYNHIHNIPIYNQSSEYCTLSDKKCKNLSIPLSDHVDDWNDTCLNDSFTAASCCSLHAEGFFVNSSRESEANSIGILSDLIDGTVSLNFDFYILNILLYRAFLLSIDYLLVIIEI
jgi:hypothetical protein